MKVTHRHQVHVQLTGNEATALFNALEYLCGGHRYDNLGDASRVVVDRFQDGLIENREGEIPDAE